VAPAGEDGGAGTDLLFVRYGKMLHILLSFEMFSHKDLYL
jgi:hypothetical protein